MFSSSDLAKLWQVKKFTSPDLNLLEACMPNQIESRLFHKHTENIASKVIMQFVHLHSKVSKVFRRELDKHRFSEPKVLGE